LVCRTDARNWDPTSSPFFDFHDEFPGMADVPRQLRSVRFLGRTGNRTFFDTVQIPFPRFEIRMARRIELRRAISLLPPMNYELTGEPHELIQIAILRRIRGVALGG
jgi:hypothetical protein